MRRRDFLPAVGFAAAACRNAGQKRVAVIPKSTAHVFWVSVQAGARAAAKQFNYEVLWNGAPAEIEFARQIQIVDSMIAQRVDGIAIAAAERKALVAPVERAMAAGIPVVVFDSGLDTDNYTSFIATDNYEGGRMGAGKLGQLLGGKGTVAVLMHAPGSVSTLDRESGFRDAVAKELPGLRIVAEQFGMADRAKARAAAENILSAHPDVQGFFASTEPSASGVTLALKARGLAGKVKVVGFDASDSMIADLREGTLDAVIVQDPFRMGFEAVTALHRKLSGATPPKRVDLHARVVTAKELDLPDVMQLLKPDLQKYL